MPTSLLYARRFDFVLGSTRPSTLRCLVNVLAAACRNVKNLLAVLGTWSVYGTSRTAPAVTEAHLAEVCAGMFPWQVGSSLGNGTEAAQRHYAQRYRTAQNQLARTVEERVVLGNEVLLALNWLEERAAHVLQRAERQQRAIADLDAAEAAAEAAGAGPEVSVGNAAGHASRCTAAAQRALSTGKLALLQREADRLRLMHGDATWRLALYVP